MATFSVIVPVYNAAHTIERCVDSIASSGGDDVQIILIEDCSKDHSWEVCCSLAKKYRTVIALRNERNRGVSYTRNRGLEAAQGEYLLFVDSDDWVEPQWASLLLAQAQSDPLWMPVCGFQIEDDAMPEKRLCVWSECGTVEQVPLKRAFDLLDRVLLQQLWTKAYRRDIIRQNRIRFDETQTMGEDLQFVLDYLEAAKLMGFSMISQPLYHYSSNTGTLMRSFGLVDRREEYERLARLGRLTADPVRYEKALDALKKNHVYHILRSKLPRHKKRALAKEILGREAAAYCRAQQIVMLKEQIADLREKIVGKRACV